MAHLPQPKKPNVLVCGTPGTGKTSLCRMLAKEGLRHIDVSELVKEKHLYESKDEEYDTHIVDEDALLDELEPIMVEGGVILDSHMADLWPERWIHLVVVLRVTTEVLFDRLSLRGYSEKKRECNMTAEIMNHVRDEAMEGYKEGMVVERPSITDDDMMENAIAIEAFLETGAIPESKKVFAAAEVDLDALVARDMSSGSAGSAAER